MYLIEEIGVSTSDRYKIINVADINTFNPKKPPSVGEYIDVGFEDSVAKILNIGSLKSLQIKRKELQSNSANGSPRNDISVAPEEIAMVAGLKGRQNKLLDGPSSSVKTRAELLKNRKHKNTTHVLDCYNKETQDKQTRCSELEGLKSQVEQLKRKLVDKEREIKRLKIELEQEHTVQLNGNVSSKKIDEILKILKVAHPNAVLKLNNGEINDVVFLSEDVRINQQEYALINFSDPIFAVKDLILAHFGRAMLASHSLSGNKCPTKSASAMPKPPLPGGPLSVIISHVLQKFSTLSNGSMMFFCKKTKSTQTLNANHLKEAIKQKCYSCAKLI